MEDCIVIARIITFATANNRDIVRRLMGCCESFKHLTFADALNQYAITSATDLSARGTAIWLSTIARNPPDDGPPVTGRNAGNGVAGDH